MTQDTSELVVASHGDVYVAPVGTAAPTSVGSALNAAFINLGLISEDGVAWNVSPTIEEFRAWQRRNPVRRELTGQDAQATFALEQWNAENVIFAFGGGKVTESPAGQFRYDAPQGTDALDERAMVIDWQDGPNSKWRLFIPRGNVMEAVETQLVRNALSVLPITFGVLEPDVAGPPWQLHSSDPTFHS